MLLGEIDFSFFSFLLGVSFLFLEGGDFLGVRPIVLGAPQPYQWTTYARVQERAANFGAGLIHIGVKTNTNFGIFSINRPEWVRDGPTKRRVAAKRWLKKGTYGDIKLTLFCCCGPRP